MTHQAPVAFDPRIDLIRDAIPEGKPDWTENMVWTVNDPKSGVCIYGHLGRLQPDRRIWEGISLIYLPDGRRYVNRSLGASLAVARNGEYHGQPIVPGKMWRYTFDGVAQRVDPTDLRQRPVGDEPFEIAAYDLTFEAIQPVLNMHQSTLDSERMHLEHAGRVRGYLTVGDETFEIDATAYRDHSMSQRTFTTLDSETWANCAFPSGRVVSILQVRRGEREILEGQVYVDGVMHHAQPLDVPDLADAAGAPFEGRFRVQSALGEHEVSWKADPAKSLVFQLLRPVGMRPGLDWSNTDNVAAVQCPAQFTWDGEVGYGWVERARPLKSLKR